MGTLFSLSNDHEEMGSISDKIDVMLNDETTSHEAINNSDNVEVGTKFYGSHELQVTEGGEADLHRHYDNCKKYPGHKQFVPINDFTHNYLPHSFRNKGILKFITATAELTVRVAVKFISPYRPTFFPGTNQPYPFHEKRNSDVLRLGTGRLRNVRRFTEKNEEGTCSCRKCQQSATPSKVWGKVCMATATHVVFDDTEARRTSCRLFYDREVCPLVTLDDWKVVLTDVEEDRCELECATCDADLLEKLFNMEGLWHELWYDVSTKYASSGRSDKLNFIVSHPHGCSKQVTVGHWLDRQVMKDDRDGWKNTKYTYTTCTCPGSSGACVHSLGYYEDVWLSDHVHSGVNSEGRNVSAVGVEHLKSKSSDN